MPRKSPVIVAAAVCLLAFCGPSLFAQENLSHTLETKFCTIHYSEEKALSSFLWRITGEKGDLQVTEKTRNRVDEITDRVRSLLDMYPNPFHFEIDLEPQQSGQPVAHYSHPQKAISVSAERVTDGILAHEIAHAVINNSFSQPPPEKAQEIMAQYVDKHLWDELVELT